MAARTSHRPYATTWVTRADAGTATRWSSTSRTSIRNTNYRGSGETLHLIERYTRTAKDALRYEVTIDDPHTFERPWTAVLDLAPQGRMYEYACHEGNRGLENILPRRAPKSARRTPVRVTD